MNALSILISNDDYGDDITSLVSLAVTAGTIYHVRITGYSSGEQGDSVLNWSFAPPPLNDLFENAESLDGASGSATGNNLAATLQSGETSTGSNSIWYRWTAPANGRVAFDTLGSGRDTRLHIYTGDTLLGGGLSLVSSNNDIDSEINFESLTQFSATAGVTYHVRLSIASGGLPGAVALNWQYPVRPSNDHFASPASLTGDSGTVNGSTFMTGVEANEPLVYEEYHTVWFHWVAPFTGTVEFDTAGSSINTTLAVGNDGQELATFNIIAENNDVDEEIGEDWYWSPFAKVSAPVVAGHAYRIRVGSYSEGYIKLSWAQKDTVQTPSVISLDRATYEATEGGPAIQVVINRNPGTHDGPVECLLYTRDGSADGESDYVYTSAWVEFAPAATTTTVNIPIRQDRRFEGEETFYIRLGDPYPSGNAVFGLSVATAHIADDEPFIPLKANYAGLAQTAPFDKDVTGLVKINAAGNGGFSGTVQLTGSPALKFRGAFDASGKADLNLPRPSGGPLQVILRYADNGNRIRAQLVVGDKTVQAQARRIIYGGAVEVSEKAFAFTALIEGDRGMTGDVPIADGFLHASVSPKGVVKITGVLPDGTAFTNGGPLTGEDIYPLFAPLHKNKGLACASLRLSEWDWEWDEEGFSWSRFDWFKAADPKSKNFKNGFTQSRPVYLSPYVYSKRVPILAGVRETHGAADFFATGPGLPTGGVTQVFTLLENNTIALPLSPQVRITIKFLPATGFFNGTLQTGTEKPVPFQGAVFQTMEFASGYYLAPGTGGLPANGIVELYPAYDDSDW